MIRFGPVGQFQISHSISELYADDNCLLFQRMDILWIRPFVNLECRICDAERLGTLKTAPE